MAVSPSTAFQQIDAQGLLVSEDLVHVEFRKTVAVTGPTYLLLVDLDNAGGAYKHTESGSVQVAGIVAEIAKNRANDQWDADVGVILAIDGVDADIGFLEAGSVRADNTTEFGQRISNHPFPIVTSLEVSAGAFTSIAVNSIVTDSSLNTGAVNVEDIGGVLRTPAVGDVVIRVFRVSGTLDANIYYGLTYRTVA